MTVSATDMSTESTPGLTETSNTEIMDNEEDMILQELITEAPLTEEQKQFNHLSKDKKLAKLNSLVEQSKVFSSIIADTLFQSTVNRAQAQAEPERPVKRRRQDRRKKPAGNSTIDDFVHVELSSEAKETKSKLEETDIRIPQPKVLSGCHMRDYQLQGMNWLITLYENGLNGILADEMGLGKTLQSISLLAFLYEQGMKGPFLITCPLSTCSNWLNEIKTFAPTIPVLSYVGKKEDRKALRDQLFKGLNGKAKKNAQTPVIVVSSYEIVIRDRTYLDKIDWKFLIVDEGHRLKNANCLLIKELKRLRTSNRLLLTGTPLQNNLDELWSLLNFILPDIFHDIDLFQQWFDFGRLKSLSNTAEDDETKQFIDTEIEKSLVTNLHSILKPFLLRRLKRDVIKGLPPKREYIIYANMTERQTELYKSALAKTLKKTLMGQFFKEYLKVNHYRLGTDAEIDEFMDRQFAIQKKTSQLASDLLAGAVTYEKRKDRSTRSKKRIVIVEEEDENRDLLRSDDEDYAPLQQSDDDSDVQELGAEEVEGSREFTLKQLWDRVKKELDGKKLQNLMMQLRLICDSPYLFFFPWEDESKVDTTFINSSGKLMMLNQILPRLIREDHKVLIFSQFTRMLDLVQDWCEFNSLKTCRIDGSTDQADRSDNISRFNKDKSFKVFLLSTRAGGLGLNLTASDTVILFDSDWNPQVDLQAMDRVHRIGQTKPVIIYRFATVNTVEQVLLSKADSKRKLERLVISMGKFENVFNDKNKASKHDTDRLASDLNQLFMQSSVFDNNKSIDHSDNILTTEEMEEIFDRSPEAYTRSVDAINSNKDFKHISIFETVTAME